MRPSLAGSCAIQQLVLHSPASCTVSLQDTEQDGGSPCGPGTAGWGDPNNSPFKGDGDPSLVNRGSMGQVPLPCCRLVGLHCPGGECEQKPPAG